MSMVKDDIWKYVVVGVVFFLVPVIERYVVEPAIYPSLVGFFLVLIIYAGVASWAVSDAIDLLEKDENARAYGILSIVALSLGLLIPYLFGNF